MAHKFSPERFQKLEAEDRYERLQPVQRLKNAGMTPGQQVLDVGCGTGFYSRSAAEIVGESGHIIGLDILSEMITRAEEFGLPDNVECIKSEESTFPVDDESMDWVIMTNLYHELENQQAFVSEIHRVLEPNGRVYFLDWKRQEEDDGPPMEHRIDKSVPMAAFQNTGFNFVSDAEVGPSHYELIFEKQ